jgi:serine/threonine protein kinase
MQCPDQETIEHYVLGRLEPDTRNGFEAHLKSCSSCAAKVAEARENESVLIELRTFDKRTRQSLRRSGSNIDTIDRAQSVLGDRYRVIRRVGEGSAGDVFQAVDTVLERVVAIKFLRQNSSTDSAENETWREARLMSQLNHPNIAQIYEIGEVDRQRFIVMEWVDGPALTEAWKALPLEQRLRIYLAVLEAVSAAHRRGIIHRDIKPSNILVTSQSKPKVLDFGIAVDAHSLENIEKGLYRGTPAYSAPEQISPPVKISCATDVFALGILLYELLTDALPFAQTETKELFQAIRSEYPQLPSAIQQRIPIPLQNICLKALEKEPAKRYQDAQSLYDDINRFLRGEKVWSRPSFLVDKIQQELFYHRQKLKVWHGNELITQKEFDKLENIYERVVSPPDPSIIEARKLSLSQVCLYLGGWIVVLGCFVLFYKSWERISPHWQPTPAVAATGLMIVLGLTMWRSRESRLAVGFLSTANLLVPLTILLALAQWGLLSRSQYPWGFESIYELTKAEHIVVGNIQLFVSFCCWLIFSLILVWITRSSIFMLFSVFAFLALLTTCYMIAGMVGIPDGSAWEPDIIAGRYLSPGIGLFVLGMVADIRKYKRYAWSLCSVGLGLIVLSLSVVALSDNTLFGWVYRKPASFKATELRLLSFACNGLIYLGLASVCRLLGTRLQRTLARILNWLGPVHILAPLRILDLEVLGPEAIEDPQTAAKTIAESHQLLYRVLLPIASIGFVFASVTRQMKSFFFSGLGGIAASVHKLTRRYLEDYFTWPISLIVTGIAWMFVSWLVPRWKASTMLKGKE